MTPPGALRGPRGTSAMLPAATPGGQVGDCPLLCSRTAAAGYGKDSCPLTPPRAAAQEGRGEQEDGAIRRIGHGDPHDRADGLPAERGGADDGPVVIDAAGD